eukprot:COSAG03_NODE_70_length_14773_cov_16.054711_13_plen_459_part_00
MLHCKAEMGERQPGNGANGGFGAVNGGLFSTLHASVFFSVAGYALVIPWMKDLLGADQLGAARYGQLQSLGNLSGLLSSAPVGRVADRMGRRAGMVLCSGLATLGAVCLWMGTVDGVLTWLPVAGLMLRRSERASFTAVATAVTADASSSDTDRSRRIGQLNMVFCLGFTFGSTVTGKIGDFAESVDVAPARLVATAAVFMGLLTLFVVGVLLPIPAATASGSSTKTPPSSSSTSTGVVLPPPMIWDHRIFGLLVVRVLVGGAFFLVTSTFDLYCRDRFGFQGGDYGRFLAFAGLCWAAVNGAVVPRLFDRFVGEQDSSAMEQKLLVGALLSLGLSRFAYSYCDLLGLSGLFIVEFCVAVGGATFFSLFASMLSRCAPQEHRAFTLGLAESCHGMAGVIGPVASGWLFENVSSSAPAVTAGMLCIFAAPVAMALPLRVTAPSEFKGDAVTDGRKRKLQ